MSIYVGKANRINYPAMRGPCPIGYHVPTMDERITVVNTGVSLGARTASGGDNLRIKLHIPFAGFRSITGTVNHQTYGRYWSCSVDSAKGKYLFLGASQISTTTSDVRCIGFSIRPFKDVPTKPSSSWTTIQSGTGGAGIYRSSTLGLISISSDGSTRYTLADKNLGATSVYSDGDTLDQTNCGNYYQWGNCYGTPRTGTVTTSSTQVNASGYGPGNWYYSSTFITGSGDRSSSKNDNLRGGVVGAVKADVKDICVGAGIKDYTVFQGPCPDGFHIPINNGLYDWSKVLSAGTTLGAWSSGSYSNFSTYLKLPLAGYISGSSGGQTSKGSEGWYANTASAGGLWVRSSSVTAAAHSMTDGISVRPFRNIPAVPDSTWTTIYQGTGSAGIFWSKGLGLISISSDGTTWWTMADKNLGATKVWNSGDTLSEDNCGWYFQNGNNRPFAYTYPSTTSTTQVDLSNYGPSYPYYSNTFIKRSSSPYQWGTSTVYLPGQANSTYYNLWGGQLINSGNLPYKGNVKYVYLGTTQARPTYNPGIYWDKAKGLISVSSDGKKWYTIADRNAGAKIVYNYGDTLNTDNAGGLYQWGNNYPFPYTGTLSKSSTRVSTTSYSWQNPYWSSTFITTNGAPHDWSSNQNANLWGNTTNTTEARRGPCFNGFHVPTETELYGLRTAMITGLGITTTADWSKYLKIPLAGNRSNQGTSANAGVEFDWLTSTTEYGTYSFIRALYGRTSGDGLVTTYTLYASHGYSVRPFKDEPVVPDNSRYVLYKPS